jgi:hypothetical protein
MSFAPSIWGMLAKTTGAAPAGGAAAAAGMVQANVGHKVTLLTHLRVRK